MEVLCCMRNEDLAIWTGSSLNRWERSSLTVVVVLAEMLEHFCSRISIDWTVPGSLWQGNCRARLLYGSGKALVLPSCDKFL